MAFFFLLIILINELTLLIFSLNKLILLFTFLNYLVYNQFNLKEGVHYGLSSNHKLSCLQ